MQDILIKFNALLSELIKTRKANDIAIFRKNEVTSFIIAYVANNLGLDIVDFHYNLSESTIIISDYNYSEYNFIRPWRFLPDDVLPFTSLSFDNLNSLAYTISSDAPQTKLSEHHRDESFFTYSELDYAQLINSRMKAADNKPIVLSDNDPAKYQNWFSFSGRQKEIISKIHQLEKKSRFKTNNPLKLI